jgi:hypothetical protein
MPTGGDPGRGIPAYGNCARLLKPLIGPGNGFAPIDYSIDRKHYICGHRWEDCAIAVSRKTSANS